MFNNKNKNIMEQQTLINAIAHHCQWHKTVNEAYKDVCEENIERLQNLLPHGSGIDRGCEIDVEKSGNQRVVIHVPYHHMDVNGMYSGWADYKLVITPELGLSKFNMRITGRDRNQTKEYLHDLFDYELDQLVNLLEHESEVLTIK